MMMGRLQQLAAAVVDTFRRAARTRGANDALERFRQHIAECANTVSRLERIRAVFGRHGIPVSFFRCAGAEALDEIACCIDCGQTEAGSARASRIAQVFLRLKVGGRFGTTGKTRGRTNPNIIDPPCWPGKTGDDIVVFDTAFGRFSPRDDWETILSRPVPGYSSGQTGFEAIRAVLDAPALTPALAADRPGAALG